MKLYENSIMTIGPVAGSDNASSSPFTLASDQDLVLHQETHQFPSGKKNIVFPRFYMGWDTLVKRLTPDFEGLWRSVGIYDLIQLSLLEIEPCATVLEGVLNYWSPSCNSLIFPMGPVSITLRDVVALTGLLVFGEEVPSRIETTAFPDVKAVPLGTYVQIIKNKLDQEVLTSDDHVHFLWLLLNNYIFKPLGGRPTAEILVIAKALDYGTPLALGTMLLAQTFHRLDLTIGENVFAKPKIGLWLFQLWIFAYFPNLATEMPIESSGCLSIDLCYTSSELSDTEWWPIFCTTRRLHYGVARTKSSRSSYPDLVLYAPCLCGRQLGFFQAIPGPLKFHPIVQCYGASEEDIEAALADMANDQGSLLLLADQPSFNIWWTTKYKQCVPPLDSSGSSSKETKVEKTKQDKVAPNGKGKEKMLPEDEYVPKSVPNYEFELRGMRTSGAPLIITEKAPANESKPLEVADLLDEEEDLEEDFYLNFGDIGEAQGPKEIPIVSSNLLSFDFESSDVHLTPLQPPASMYLPSSLSLDRLIPANNSQESCLVRSRLELVTVKAENPYASLDYNFLTKTTASSSMPNADAIRTARNVLTHFVSSPLASWTSDQIGQAISSFDLLLSACNSVTKAELLKTIKAKSNMSELQSYNKKYEALIECERKEKDRLMKADEECLFELELEMAVIRARKDEMVLASSEFRDRFPQMECDLQREKLRLNSHYDDMVKWHGESVHHKQTAAKLCDDRDKYPKRDFDYFP